jgi:hypothetical protein
MMPDFALETTFDFKFTTRQFSDGAPVTFSSGAVEIYEDNDVAQITGAETLTIDFDGITGLHNLRIAATAANGFGAGQSYSAVASAGTVGGTSVVGEVILNFTIEHQSALRPATAGRELEVDANSRVDVGSWLGTAVTLGAGAPDVNIQSTDNIDLSVLQKTAVNAEVLDVMDTDTLTEPAQGKPAALVSAFTVLRYAWATFRNLEEQTATEYRVFNDAGTRLCDAAISDTAGTVTKAEMETGA